MPGSATITPDPIPVARSSAALAVYLYDPTQTDFSLKYTLLPNIRCLGASVRVGADPGAARFRYVFQDPSLAPDFPSRIEEVFSLDATGPYIVKTDDELVVVAIRSDGYHEMLMHCYAQVPQADLSAEVETVSFMGIGAPIREWDTPLPGAVVRDADSPTTISDIQTDLPVRFNPDGKPNASPNDSGDSPATYPVFLGPVSPSNKINGSRIRFWWLGMAARYIIVEGTKANDNPIVTYKDLTYLDDLLLAIRPVDEADSGTIDIDDDSTWEGEDIIVQDIDVTGMAWPVALERLIEPHGFKFRFQLSETDPGDDDFGDPVWTIVIYNDNFSIPVMDLNLQEAGSAPLDPSQTNLGHLNLARDIHGIANRIAIDAAPIRVEASFILAPGFEVSAGDAAIALTDAAPWKLKNDPTGADADKYRLYIFDECGEGHWEFPFMSTLNNPTDLKSLLTFKAKSRPFVRRRRPGVGTLLTTDDKGKPLRFAVFASFDYAGPMPAVWDGFSGTWEELQMGSIRLLDDRLGFVFTMEDPNSFEQQSSGAVAQFAGGKFNSVEWSAAPTASFPYPRFMLVCCIDADQDFNVVAPNRIASPTQYAITRRVDARDRFFKKIVSKSSIFRALAGPGTDDLVVDDDTDDAQAHADGVRKSEESGTFSGSATIPRLSTAYTLGVRIRKIVGRGLSLRTNAAAEAGESAIYPGVVGIEYSFEDGQHTTLEMTDRRAEPPPRRSRRSTAKAGVQ